MISDVYENAFNAAFKDPRFKAITKEEFSKINIKISLLSSLTQIFFQTQEQLLEQLTIGKTGLLIQTKQNQAVFLPSVWDYFDNKKDFLNALKQKALVPIEYPDNKLKAYIFTSETIIQS